MSTDLLDGVTAIVWCLVGLLWAAVVIGCILYEVQDYFWWKRFNKRR